MLWSDIIASAFRSLRQNGFRSVLTMLGIIIGVGSVVLMTAVGAGMQEVLLGQISSLGSSTMAIFPGGGPEQGGVGTGQQSLTLEDLKALEKLSTIDAIAPVIFVREPVSKGEETTKGQVFGTRPTFYMNQSISAAIGRMPDERDEQARSRVVAIGPDVAIDLFGNKNPLNQKIRVGSNPFTVIGVVNPIGSQFFQNADTRMYVPFNTARSITGQKYMDYATFQAVDNFDVAKDDVISLIRERHQIDNPENDEEKDDFDVRTSAQAMGILSGVSLGLTMFITIIASISLVVGGIGIMNIMYVSVQERTREIGLRKALGAKRKDVLRQFMIEAIVITLLGSVIGILGGIFFAWIIAAILVGILPTYVFAISPLAIVVALIVAVAIGTFFGLAPARQAAEIEPMAALRYE
jgi:putative ABC transport system permease protein